MLMLAPSGSHDTPLPPIVTPKQPRPRVLALCGKAGSGKSEAARHLIGNHQYKNGKFARALKEMTRAFLRYRGVADLTIEEMIEGGLKELPSPHLNGRSPRYFMQRLGTEFGREEIHQDLWVDTEMDHIKSWPKVVFDDARFPNEVAAIRSAGGLLIEVKRPGHVGTVHTAHESEVHQFVPDYFILNDGSLDDLRAKLDRVA